MKVRTLRQFDSRVPVQAVSSLLFCAVLAECREEENNYNVVKSLGTLHIGKVRSSCAKCMYTIAQPSCIRLWL